VANHRAQRRGGWRDESAPVGRPGRVGARGRRGDDRTMTHQERLFLYLPFEHSEDPADQALAVTLIGRLGNGDWTRFALAHKASIDRFGRFPHRNDVLGRISTEDEIALLQYPTGSY